MFSGLSQFWWVNLAGFQLAWWLCILMGNDALWLIVALLVLHFAGHRKPGVECLVVTSCAALGFAVDTFLTLYGVFIFSSEQSLPPLWLFLLWFAFSATLRQGLAWFSGRYLISALAGSLAGTLTYLAAGRLGAVSFGPAELQVAGLLALVWLLLFPALVKLADIVGGWRATA